MKVRSALVTTMAVASLALAACGGSQEEPQEPQAPQGVASKPAPTSRPTEPLTGLRVAAGDHAARARPVLVLKMDNTASSAPQLGLSSADLVIEELVEGGATRLAAFYYSTLPGEVGPVRSMRASDIGIVSPVDATVVTSGAASVTIKRINGAGIKYVTEGSAGFFRDPSRYSPYNLMTSMTAVAKKLEQKPARPRDYLPFGPVKDLPAGRPARSLQAIFGSHTTSWSYDAKTKGYINENTYAADGDEFPADTVLVLRVQVGDAGYLDPANNPVPETKLEGTGAALLFHGGKVVRGTWTKDALDAPIQLATADGPLVVPAGHTWIELVPAVTGDVTFAR